ncbi:MAG: hypothetical protein JO170_05005 [Verrucomicrobia bacterium]|nr:hypothetical protein [Verrucomicrobiota bacterium]
MNLENSYSEGTGVSRVALRIVARNWIQQHLLAWRLHTAVAQTLEAMLAKAEIALRHLEKSLRQANPRPIHIC